MVQTLSNHAFISASISDRKELLPKNFYFDNEAVERLMYRYIEGACIDVQLRDEIMTHARELIEQTIKAHNLSQIYPGREESSYGDLFQVAWIQIESALYKYEARPHCSKCYNNQRPNDSLLIDEFLFLDDLIKKVKVCPKCKVKLAREGVYYKGKSRIFNLWSQVARTVILAYIKKENRDRKNSPVFQTHIENRSLSKANALERFITEAEEVCKNNTDFLVVVEAIKELYQEDDKPYEGLITKLVAKTGLQRGIITNFLRVVRLRQAEFSDSPVNEETKVKNRKTYDEELEDGNS